MVFGAKPLPLNANYFVYLRTNLEDKSHSSVQSSYIFSEPSRNLSWRYLLFFICVQLVFLWHRIKISTTNNKAVLLGVAKVSALCTQKDFAFHVNSYFPGTELWNFLIFLWFCLTAETLYLPFHKAGAGVGGCWWIDTHCWSLSWIHSSCGGPGQPAHTARASSVTSPNSSLHRTTKWVDKCPFLPREGKPPWMYWHSAMKKVCRASALEAIQCFCKG